MLKSILSAALFVAVAGLCGPFAVAAPSESPALFQDPVDPNFAAGKQALEAKDWKAAVAAFTKAVEKEPSSADAHNLLAYSNRKSGNLDIAFKHYNEALRLDPKHRGAHEYIGEAYLMVGNLAKAEEHLNALDKLCFFPCEEFRDLKRAVSDYRQKSAAK